MDLGIKIAILGASLSIFLEFCFSYGNIFSGYFRFITAYLRYGLSKRNKYYIDKNVKIKFYNLILFYFLILFYCENKKLNIYNIKFLFYPLIKGKKYFIRPETVPKYKIWLFKIFGGCIYCNNVYLTTGAYSISAFPNLTLTDWLLSVVLSHVLLQLYYKYMD